MATRKGVSMAQIAIAWIITKDGQSRFLNVSFNLFSWCIVGVTAPIVGTTSLANLHDIIGMFSLDQSCVN